ncbi:MAG: signal peptidase II [Caldilinea sp. CFX5]|nr:signal peptidase II [Caldilinea sp. CFX5]
MSKINRILILLFVLISCVGCDQATKFVARQTLATAPMQEYAGGLFRLVYAENPGAFLSLGATLPHTTRFWIFVVMAALLLTGVGIFALRYLPQTPLPVIVSIALVIGGGLGNLIDRIVHDGRVVDFMQVGFPWLRTGVFNVADMAIMAGVGLMLVATLRGQQEQASD